MTGANISSINPGSQVVQQVMIECMQPFLLPLALNLNWIGTKGQKFEYELTLPVCITHFVEKVAMPGPDFMARWQKLTGEVSE